jgi:hypothetical protein
LLNSVVLQFHWWKLIPVQNTAWSVQRRFFIIILISIQKMNFNPNILVNSSLLIVAPWRAMTSLNMARNFKLGLTAIW